MPINLFEEYKKSTLETALNEFGEKYAKFCNDHTCCACPLSPSPGCGIIGSPEWTKACKAHVIDHLTEANKKMDEALKKEAEVKKKKENTARHLLYAIKAEKRDLEYRNIRDTDYILLNPDDYDLIKSNTTFCLAYCLPSDSDISYGEIYGMRIVYSSSIKRGEFVIGFKTDSHIKEVTE